MRELQWGERGERKKMSAGVWNLLVSHVQISQHNRSDRRQRRQSFVSECLPSVHLRSLSSFYENITDSSWIHSSVKQTNKKKREVVALPARPLPLSYIEADCIWEASATPRSWPLAWTSGMRGCCRSGCSLPGRRTLTFYACRWKNRNKPAHGLWSELHAVYQM